MKKTALFFSFVLLFSSCSLPSYVFEDNNSKTGLNLKEGKWLLNETDTPVNYKKDCKELIYTHFINLTGGRVVYIHDAKGLLVPKKIGMNPSKIVLADLKEGTGYDFFINTKAIVTKNSLQDLELTNHKFNKSKSKSVEVYFEVYDLNITEIIYSKKVIGSIKINDNNNSDINFSKSVSKLVKGSFKKILRDIEKRSIISP